jgi:hypothetical protein
VVDFADIQRLTSLFESVDPQRTLEREAGCDRSRWMIEPCGSRRPSHTFDSRRAERLYGQQELGGQMIVAFLRKWTAPAPNRRGGQ